MSNFGTYAICPYFLSEDNITIKCEGVVQLNQTDASYHVKFENKDMKKNWIHNYCESRDYLKCPYAALLESNYDKQGNKVI